MTRMLIGGFSAYSRYKDWARMRAIADKAGAIFWVDMAHRRPRRRRQYPNPPHAHVVTSTTHKTLRGPRGIVLSRGGGARSARARLGRVSSIRAAR